MFDKLRCVFSMTNEAERNHVVAFARNKDGSLTWSNSYYTGGSGTGVQMNDPLMSQGSMVTSSDGHLLFVVNAGSNSISSFAISGQGELCLVDTVPSGGDQPNSLAVSGNVLYVANHGNDDKHTPSNITGFSFECCGKLCQIPYASYSLSSSEARPASIVFSPFGDRLIVSELTTNRLTVYPVSNDGLLMQGFANSSNGSGPFGSAFLKNGVLLVAEAGTNALSSYINPDKGILSVISGSVTNGQMATCWISTGESQQVAYTSNAGSGTISIYDINYNGELALRESVFSNPNGTAAPLDSGVSRDGKYFYVLNGNEGSISVFSIGYGGDLNLIQVLVNTGLPQDGSQGLAVL